MSHVSSDHLHFDQPSFQQHKVWSTFLSSAFYVKKNSPQIINPELVGLFTPREQTLLQSNTKKMPSLPSPKFKSWSMVKQGLPLGNHLSVDDYFKYSPTMK